MTRVKCDRAGPRQWVTAHSHAKGQQKSWGPPQCQDGANPRWRSSDWHALCRSYRELPAAAALLGRRVIYKTIWQDHTDLDSSHCMDGFIFSREHSLCPLSFLTVLQATGRRRYHTHNTTITPLWCILQQTSRYTWLAKFYHWCN